MAKLAVKTQPTQEKKLATQPQPIPPATGATPPPAQTVPPAPPTPPAGPAAPAAKSKPKRGLDLSGLSPEAKEKVEALRKSLAEERKKVTSDLAAKEQKALADLGVKMPERKVAARRETGVFGLNLDFKATVPQGIVDGWKNETDKTIGKAITDAGGLTLKALAAREDVGGWPWIRQRFVRNQLLINGKTFTDIVNKGAV